MKSTLRVVFLAGAVISVGASARAGGLAIVGSELQDNGDHDGYADTNETVQWRSSGLVDELTDTIGFFDPTDKNVLSWHAEPGATSYGILRSLHRTTSNPGMFCLHSSSTAPSHDTSTFPPPPLGRIYFYLVRVDAPQQGSLGTTSSGGTRPWGFCN